jgi:two-component system, OmpR family, phosphate regulon sensor histidine kinase PhoR
LLKITDKNILRLLIFGSLTIIGVIVGQFYWLAKSWDMKDSEFDQSIHIVLRNVAYRLSEFTQTDLPKQNLIQRRSSNYYTVNVNAPIDANVLEDFLFREMEAINLKTDFEYAVYDCFTDELVYGNYCKFNAQNIDGFHDSVLPKFDDLVYYFAVRFPDRGSFLLTDLRINLFFAFVSVLAIIFFTITMFIIVRQKKLSDLQKEFINNMTHEFKTPITSIKIASEMLMRDPGVKAEEKLSKYTSIIHTQNKRLNDQVETVLNVVKLDNEDFRFKKENIEIIELLKGIVANETHRIPQGLIVFENETGADEIVVNADILHFTNIIYNLTDNASKYNQRKPEIHIVLEKAGSTLMLHVRDNGIGIDQDKIQSLFKKFYRVPTGNVHNVKGFGLGLYYVKKVCEAHDWDIRVDSVPGEGSTFTIIFKS